MRRQPLSPYSSALLEAMIRRAHGETTREQYLREIEHAAAVHDRMADRAQFAQLAAGRLTGTCVVGP